MDFDRYLKAFRIVATCAVLVGAAIYLYNHRGDLEVLVQLRVRDSALLTASMLGLFVAAGYAFNLLVSMLSARLSPTEWIGLTIVGTALNYLAPTHPGVFIKAAYLKRKTAMAYSRFSALLAASFLLVLFFTALIGLFVLALLRIAGEGGLLLLLACGIIAVVTPVLLFVPLPRLRSGGRIGNLLDNAVNGFQDIRSRRWKLLEFGGAVLGQHVFAALSCFIAFRALGFEIDWGVAFALVIFSAIANVFAITPNNIGVLELVMATVYRIAGLNFDDGLLGAALIRMAHLLVSFCLGPLFLYFLLGRSELRLSAVLSGRLPSLGEDGAKEPSLED